MRHREEAPASYRDTVKTEKTNRLRPRDPQTGLVRTCDRGKEKDQAQAGSVWARNRDKDDLGGVRGRAKESAVQPGGWMLGMQKAGRLAHPRPHPLPIASRPSTSPGLHRTAPQPRSPLASPSPHKLAAAAPLPLRHPFSGLPNCTFLHPNSPPTPGAPQPRPATSHPLTPSTALQVRPHSLSSGHLPHFESPRPRRGPASFLREHPDTHFQSF